MAGAWVPTPIIDYLKTILKLIPLRCRELLIGGVAGFKVDPVLFLIIKKNCEVSTFSSQDCRDPCACFLIGADPDVPF